MWTYSTLPAKASLAGVRLHEISCGFLGLFSSDIQDGVCMVRVYTLIYSRRHGQWSTHLVECFLASWRPSCSNREVYYLHYKTSLPFFQSIVKGCLLKLLFTASSAYRIFGRSLATKLPDRFAMRFNAHYIGHSLCWGCWLCLPGGQKGIRWNWPQGFGPPLRENFAHLPHLNCEVRLHYDADSTHGR